MAEWLGSCKYVRHRRPSTNTSQEGCSKTVPSNLSKSPRYQLPALSFNGLCMLISYSCVSKNYWGLLSSQHLQFSQLLWASAFFQRQLVIVVTRVAALQHAQLHQSARQRLWKNWRSWVQNLTIVDRATFVRKTCFQLCKEALTWYNLYNSDELIMSCCNRCWSIS